MPQVLSFQRKRKPGNIFKKQWIPGQVRNDGHEALLACLINCLYLDEYFSFIQPVANMPFNA